MKRHIITGVFLVLVAVGFGWGQDITRNLAGWLLTSPLSSAQLAAGITNETGTGLAVFNDAPTFIAPVLGTPASGVGTNLTGTAAGLTVGLATNTVTKTGTGSTYATGTGPTFTDPIITNIAPGADFTLTQNSVAVLTSLNAAAVANTLYVKAGFVGLGGTTAPLGMLHVGNTANLNSANPGVLLNRVVPNGLGSGHGFADNSTLVAANIGYNSFDARMNITEGAAMDHYSAFQAYPNFNSTAGLGTLTGYASVPTMAAGNVTTLNHFQVADTLGAGTVGTQYGLYIGALSKGTINYAIYTAAGTKNFFGGRSGSTVSPDTLWHIRSVGTTDLAYYTAEASDLLAGAGVKLKTNTTLRWTIEVPTAASNLQFTNASAAVGFSMDQNRNLGLSTNTFGTGAVGVLGIKNGTCASTSPADYTEICGLDVSGAGTAGIRIRGELGDLYFIGNNHITQKQATAPTVSATTCGTTPVIAGVDEAFRVTVDGTGALVCTVTFNKPFANAPICAANNETTANLTRVTASTTTAVVAGTMVTGDKFTVLCKGYES